MGNHRCRQRAQDDGVEGGGQRATRQLYVMRISLNTRPSSIVHALPLVSPSLYSADAMYALESIEKVRVPLVRVSVTTENLRRGEGEKVTFSV
jgi:hypothetical protein